MLHLALAACYLALAALALRAARGSTLLPRDESAVSRELVRNATVAARLLAAFASTSGMLHLVEAALALRDSPGDNGLDGGLGLARLVLRVTHGLILGGSVVYCLANATKVQEAMQDVELISTRTVAASTRQLRHAAALTQAAFACAREREVEIARTKQAGLDLAAHLMTTGPKVVGRTVTVARGYRPLREGADRPEASQ